MLERAFNEKVPRNTIHYWAGKYSEIFTYLRIRQRNEKRNPLLPRTYGETIYSMHRNKTNLLPERLKPLSDYLFQVKDGIEDEKMNGKPFVNRKIENVTPYLNRRIFEEDTPEIKIAYLAEENEETDPLRSILINDDITLCRNVPLYKTAENGELFSDFTDLLQYKDGKIILLTYLKNIIFLF